MRNPDIRILFGRKEKNFWIESGREGMGFWEILGGSVLSTLAGNVEHTNGRAESMERKLDDKCRDREDSHPSLLFFADELPVYGAYEKRKSGMYIPIMTGRVLAEERIDPLLEKFRWLFSQLAKINRLISCK